MPSAKELEREISLKDGEAFIGLIDPKGVIDVKDRDGRNVWTFHLLVDGEPCSIQGGKRLKNAFLMAGLRKWEGPRNVRILASGAERSFDRTYTVTEVSK